jgi:hypothetical protein
MINVEFHVNLVKINQGHDFTIEVEFVTSELFKNNLPRLIHHFVIKIFFRVKNNLITKLLEL